MKISDYVKLKAYRPLTNQILFFFYFGLCGHKMAPRAPAAICQAQKAFTTSIIQSIMREQEVFKPMKSTPSFVRYRFQWEKKPLQEFLFIFLVT